MSFRSYLKKVDFRSKSWTSTQKPDFGDFEGSSLMGFLKARELKFDMRPSYRLSNDHVKIQPSIL